MANKNQKKLSLTPRFSAMWQNKEGFIQHFLPFFLTQDKGKQYLLSINHPTIKERSAGFTLIELLVVIAIVGLLTGVMMLALNNARTRARDAKRAGDIRQLVTALEQYYIQNGAYPTGTASIASGGTGTLLSDPSAMNGVSEPMIPNYAPLIPTAPTPADGSCSNSPGRGNNNYWYDVADDGLIYTMTFCLGKDTGDWLAGARSATPNGIQ